MLRPKGSSDPQPSRGPQVRFAPRRWIRPLQGRTVAGGLSGGVAPATLWILSGDHRLRVLQEEKQWFQMRRKTWGGRINRGDHRGNSGRRGNSRLLRSRSAVPLRCPFLDFEGPCGPAGGSHGGLRHLPARVADLLENPWGHHWNDPVSWARKCLELGADLICLRLDGCHPERGNRTSNRSRSNRQAGSAGSPGAPDHGQTGQHPRPGHGLPGREYCDLPHLRRARIRSGVHLFRDGARTVGGFEGRQNAGTTDLV